MIKAIKRRNLKLKVMFYARLKIYKNGDIIYVYFIILWTFLILKFPLFRHKIDNCF